MAQAQKSASIPASQRYTKLEKLGEGNYGAVYKGWDAEAGRLVALKRLHLRDRKEHSLPGSTLREIYTLRELTHPGVVQLLDVVFSDAWQLYMVFECLESDLKHYIELLSTKKEVINPMLLKSYMYQMLSAVNFCHERRIMHRDLKPENILLSSSGNLKIADFGLARSYSSVPPAYTHNVVTLWYRAPEVLLGAAGYQYSPAVDMWSLGCIFAELLILTPLFPGNFEVQQLMKIFELRGTPIPVHPRQFRSGDKGWPWPGVDDYPNYSSSWPKWPRSDLRDDPRFANIPMVQLDASCLDTLDQLLTYTPSHRISAKDCMLHPFFDDYVQLRRDIDIESSARRRRLENSSPWGQIGDHKEHLDEILKGLAAQHVRQQGQWRSKDRAASGVVPPDAGFNLERPVVRQPQPHSRPPPPFTRPPRPISHSSPGSPHSQVMVLSPGSPNGLSADVPAAACPSPGPPAVGGKRRAAQLEGGFFGVSPDEERVAELFQQLENFWGTGARWPSAAEPEAGREQEPAWALRGQRHLLQVPDFKAFRQAKQNHQHRRQRCRQHEQFQPHRPQPPEHSHRAPRGFAVSRGVMDGFHNYAAAVAAASSSDHDIGSCGSVTSSASSCPSGLAAMPGGRMLLNADHDDAWPVVPPPPQAPLRGPFPRHP